MKNNKILNKLKKLRKQKIKNASEFLLSEDNKSAKEALDWLDTTNKILDKYKKKPNTFKWSILIGALSIIIAGLSLYIQIPTTNFSLEILTESATFDLVKNSNLSTNFQVQYFYINQLQRLNAFGLGYSAEEQPNINFEAIGSDIVLDQLKINKNARVTFTKKKDDLFLFVKNDMLEGSVNIKQADIKMYSNLQEKDTTIDVEIPETILFTTNIAKKVPIELQFTDTVNSEFSHLSAKKVHFLQEIALNSGEFESTVISGKIKILESGKETIIEEKDILDFENLKTSRVYITEQGALLKILIVGKASKIIIGPLGYERNIKPTLLEYIYHEQILAFFWGAIIFLWSFIWSFKKTIFDK